MKEAAPDDESARAINYYDPDSPVGNLSGNLPHWRQFGVTYFVTFRLADSLPTTRLREWRTDLAAWLKSHPEPHDETTRREFYDRFPARLQGWLDAGHGSCVLAFGSAREKVESALRFFDGQRYRLHEYVVANNHVHAIVAPLGEHTLSDILHSWKSFTAHLLLKDESVQRRLAAVQGKVDYKVAAASRRRNGNDQMRDASATLGTFTNVALWQKESFDHIIRSPASLEKFREYIRAHNHSKEGRSGT